MFGILSETILLATRQDYRIYHPRQDLLPVAEVHLPRRRRFWGRR